MNLDWTIVTSTFVGAFLAAGTGYLFELRRERSRISSARKLLKTAIGDDLKHSLSLYDKIAEEWEKTKTVWFSTLNELKESRFTYQNNKDWINIFDDSDLRRAVFRYYLQTAEQLNTLEYQQRRKYEIESRLNDTIRDIKLREPSVVHDDAVKTAVSYMENENREYENLLRLIPESMQKLAQFKLHAQDLLNRLGKVK